MWSHHACENLPNKIARRKMQHEIARSVPPAATTSDARQPSRFQSLSREALATHRKDWSDDLLRGARKFSTPASPDDLTCVLCVW